MKNITTIICAAVLILSSCKKDSTVFVADPGYQLDSAWVNTIADQSKIAELIKSILPPAPLTDTTEIFKLDTTFIRTSAFDIIIPPGTLKGSSAGDVFGKVNYNFFLLQKKGDFILLQQSTVNNEKYLLHSGGGFFIRFFRGTEELTIIPGKNIIVRYNDPQPVQGMKVFYGFDNITISTPVNTSTGWTSASTSAYVKPIQRKFNNVASYGYEISTDRLRWVDAGITLTSTSAVNLSVYVPDLFSNANTQAYIVFKDYRTIVQLTGDAGSRKFMAPNIPVNKAATIVTISKIAQEYFLGTQDIITSDQPIKVSPIKGGLDRIINYIHSL